MFSELLRLILLLYASQLNFIPNILNDTKEVEES